MSSHIGIYWTNPAVHNDTEELISWVTRCLKAIPGVQHFHIGRMAPTERAIVDKTYQVAVNMTFPDKKTMEEYHAHPLYSDFVQNVYRRFCRKAVVYDFE